MPLITPLDLFAHTKEAINAIHTIGIIIAKIIIWCFSRGSSCLYEAIMTLSTVDVVVVIDVITVIVG